MTITLTTIPHSEQRYPTIGDWIIKDNGDVVISVSNMRNEKYHHLVMIHELIEVILCRHAGVSAHEVDQFDKLFELNRTPGNDSEPGDSPLAPYAKQHCIATGIERMVAAEIDVNWQEYEETLNAL